MSVALVYIGYLWVCIIHSVFSGITLYSLFGKKLIHKKKIFPIFFLAIFQGFLETYWIPIISQMGITITSNNQQILNFFDLTENTNIAAILRPSFMSIIIWLIQGMLANYIGRKMFLRNVNSIL